MLKLDKRTWAEINLDNLEHNYREIRKNIPDSCRFAGLCKANAYGHGALAVAKRLESAGADYLAVSCYEEAAELRAGGVSLPILILAPSPWCLAEEVAGLDAVQAVGDIACARQMNARLEGSGLALRVHIKLETGMGRSGFDVSIPETYKEVAEVLSMRNISAEGVFTHFAVSDEAGDSFTNTQFLRFTEAVDKLERETGRSLGIKHCANSAAVLNYPWMALDMVRPGIILYGSSPSDEDSGLDLRPVMELKTRICQLNSHKKGDTISYGRTFTCDRDMRIAVIPVGYADGLHRALSGKIEVVVGGRRARQLGRICMDMCMIDVTGLPDADVGDIVTIFGAGIPVDEQAQKAGTIPYELLCAVSQRVPRVCV